MLVVGSKSVSGPLVFFLHGLGDSGQGLADIANFFVNRDPSMTWFLPTAPQRPVTINNGAVMNAWYDIAALEHRDPSGLAGFDESVANVCTLVEQTRKELDPDRAVFLGGFSQGGVVALAAAYSEQMAPVNGVFGLSTYAVQGAHLSRGHVPLLMIHGTNDEVIPMVWAKKSFDLLSSGGVRDAQFKSMARLTHSIDMRVISEMTVFFEKHKND